MEVWEQTSCRQACWKIRKLLKFVQKLKYIRQKFCSTSYLVDFNTVPIKVIKPPFEQNPKKDTFLRKGLKQAVASYAEVLVSTGIEGCTFESVNYAQI